MLFLADDAGREQLISDVEFRDMLIRQLGDVDLGRDDGLRLVFLASCDTARRDSADAFRGLAPQLIAAGVPAVIAMQEQGTVAIDRFQWADRLMLGRDATVHFNLGNAYELMGNDYDAAEAEYIQALRLDHTLGPAYNNLARLYIVGRHDPDRALSQLSRVLHQTSDAKCAAVLHKNMGWAYLEKNWQHEALDELQQAE